MMEGAAHGVAVHFAAVSDVCTQMRAIGIDHTRFAVFPAKLHPLLTKVLHDAQIARFEIRRIADEEPSERNRQRAALLDGGARSGERRLQIRDITHVRLLL